MTREGTRNIKLGIFVLCSIVVLIVALYLIGNKQNLFGSTFRISARFNNVNGLMKGNNVRFAGIDVGTVESVEIVNDSMVNVVMVIENNVQKYIKRNAVASVGTDGLMGNKLININSGTGIAQSVEEGEILQSMKPVEMDAMVRTLDVTNQNIQVITGNLRNITDKISSKNSMWSLLMDTLVAENVKTSIINVRRISNEGVAAAGNLRDITDKVKSGKGSVGALISDTVLSGKFSQTVVKLNSLNDSLAAVTGNVSKVMRGISQGKGSVGALLSDTSMVSDLKNSIQNINSGAEGFSENMKALHYSWPFKKYYKKKKAGK